MDNDMLFAKCTTSIGKTLLEHFTLMTTNRL